MPQHVSSSTVCKYDIKGWREKYFRNYLNLYDDKTNLSVTKRSTEKKGVMFVTKVSVTRLAEVGPIIHSSCLAYSRWFKI